MRSGVRLLAYGAFAALLAVPGLALVTVVAVGLVSSIAVVGVPLLIGALALVSALARFDRWVAVQLMTLPVEDPTQPDAARWWTRAALVQVTRDTAFVFARSAVGLGALALCVAAAIAAHAGVGAFAVDGFLAGGGQWRSTAGASSWWGPVLAVGAVIAAGAVLVAAGLLQCALVGLLGPTESARVTSARRARAAADERARLAADLHDAVGHSLTVTTLHAAAAARVVRTDPDFVIGALQLIEVSSRRALGEVDRALALLSGTAPADAPDARLLPDLLSAFGAAGMTVVDDVELPGDLPSTPSEVVYRIVQEAGTNALRHGVVGELSVTIAQLGDTVSVRVVSAGGTGTDEPTRLGRGGGRGLDGLRGRCVELGGSLDAGPSCGGASWVVSASLPIKADRT